MNRNDAAKQTRGRWEGATTLSGVRAVMFINRPDQPTQNFGTQYHTTSPCRILRLGVNQSSGSESESVEIDSFSS